MAFSIRNLAVMAYANGATLWHYKSAADAVAAIAAPSYFGEAAEMLSCGDMIMVSAKDGGAFLHVDVADGPEATHTSGMMTPAPAKEAA